MPDITLLQNSATPVTPTTGYGKIYLRDDAIWLLDDNGLAQPVMATLTNLLINGGFDWGQTGNGVDHFGVNAITIGAAIAADKYGFDRWRVNGQTNTQTITASQQEGRGVPGITSRYFGRYANGVATGKVTLGQLVEGIDGIPYRGRIVSFQVKLKSNVSLPCKIGLFKHTGTIDAPATSLCNGTWGADGVDPTWSTGLAQLAQTACVLSSSFQQFIVSGTVATDTQNIVVIVWTTNSVASTVTIDLAEAGLYDGIATRPWCPRPTQQELALCERYYETVGGDCGSGFGADAYAATNAQIVALFHSFHVKKRAVPTIVKLGTWTVSNCGQPVVSSPASPDFIRLYATASAAGRFYYATVDSTTLVTANAEI